MRKLQPTENNKHVQDSTPSARLRLEFNPSCLIPNSMILANVMLNFLDLL